MKEGEASTSGAEKPAAARSPKRSRRSLRRLGSAVFPGLAFLVMVLLFWKMQNHRIVYDSQAARRAGKPLPVAVYPVDRATISQAVSVECIAKSRALIEIPDEASDNLRRRVVETHVRVGEQVKAGQPLLRLDDRLQQELLVQAEAMRDWASREVSGREHVKSQQEKSVKTGATPEVDYWKTYVDWTKSNQELVEATERLAKARFELGKSRIVAPTGGIVLEIAQPGQFSSPEKILVKLAATDPLDMYCNVADDKLTLLRSGAEVEASFFGYPGRVFGGRVLRVLPAENETDRTITVVAELPNAEGSLLPGLHGIAQIKNSSVGLRIPSVGLINPGFDNAQVLLVDEENRARIRKVTTGLFAGGYVEILDGLTAGDRVVIAGQLSLQDGDEVRINATADTTAEAALVP